MEKQEIYQKLTNELSEDTIIKLDEPMKLHTNFKIGGNSDIYIIAKTVQDIKKVAEFSKQNQIPITILGNGSNVLVSDKGIRGIVLKIALENYKIEKQNNQYAKITVGAGIPLGKLAQLVAKEKLSGFEFAAGIPGSLGGAIFMNAGAYGGETKDIIVDVTYIDENQNIVTLSKEKCQFSYRHSIFSSHIGIIIEATLLLPYGDENEIKTKIEEYAKSRKEKQPLNLPSAGSTFKRGEDFITAKVIDECGLKGYTVGNAQVSTKHAGFVVNLGGATADEVLQLIQHVKKEVLEKSSKNIELEIELLGEF